MRKARLFAPQFRQMQLATASVGLALLAFPAASRADDVSACTHIADRVARLQCFDSATSAPIPVPPAPPTPATGPSERGRLQTLAEDQELARPTDRTGWFSRTRPWGSDVFVPTDHKLTPATGQAADQIDLFITEPEDNPDDDKRAVMMVTCENNITSLLVILPHPVSGPRAAITLSGNGATLRLNWRDVENGRVISAGRGLESIDTLQPILAFKQVQLNVPLSKGTATYTFSITGLADQLKPLRFACHW